MDPIRFQFDGDIHTADRGMNHFINGVCVNPLEDDSEKIGDTLKPVLNEDTKLLPLSNLVVTGYVPHRIDIDKEGNEVFVVL